MENADINNRAVLKFYFLYSAAAEARFTSAKIWGAAPPMGRNMVFRKMHFGWVQSHI